MESPYYTELRICGIYGPKGGYFRLKIHSEADAIATCVVLRGLGLGLCYRKGKIMTTQRYMSYDSIIKSLSKVGVCRNAFFIPKGGDSPMPLSKLI